MHTTRAKSFKDVEASDVREFIFKDEGVGEGAMVAISDPGG